MRRYDYTGFSDTSRASIQMTHSAFGPTVSLEEAQRLERETADHLLKSRKLSLIVDLDQTIVHATVDPTVGEWIAEGEAWEARKDRREKRMQRERDREIEKAKRAKERDEDGSDDDSSSSSGDEDEDETETEEEDECNPNWEALKDVKKFRLGPESFGASPSKPSKGKQKVIENEGCMYYIKPRCVVTTRACPPLAETDAQLDPVGNSSSKLPPSNTKCMSTQWARVLTLRKYVRLSIQRVPFLVDAC
jgi:RNA polymerase II subunit A-like phosphatase